MLIHIKKPILLFSVVSCSQNMQRTWWLVTTTTIVTGSYSPTRIHFLEYQCSIANLVMDIDYIHLNRQFHYWFLLETVDGTWSHMRRYLTKNYSDICVRIFNAQNTSKNMVFILNKCPGCPKPQRHLIADKLGSVMKRGLMKRPWDYWKSDHGSPLQSC